MRISIRREGEPGICPFCRAELAEERRVECRECGATHHRACWSERPQCAACEHPLARDDEGQVIAGLDVGEDRPAWRPRVAARSRARAVVERLARAPLWLLEAIGGAIAWLAGDLVRARRERARRLDERRWR